MKELATFYTDAAAAEVRNPRDASCDASRDTIPEGVSEVIAHRLKRLSRAGGIILDYAAVIGREFSTTQLQAVFQRQKNDLDFLLCIEEAERGGIIEPLDSGRYRFIHRLIQESLLEQLGPSGRARLHAEVGLAIEALLGSDAKGHAAELLGHFVEASGYIDVGKVAGYAAAAGEQALAIFAYEDALRFFKIASRSGSSDPPDAAKIQFNLGRTYAFLMRPEEAIDCICRAFDAFVDLECVEEAIEVASIPFLPIDLHNAIACSISRLTGMLLRRYRCVSA